MVLIISLLSPALSAKDVPLSMEIDHVYVDVRSGPGHGYPVFHALEREEDVVVLKRRTDWVKVKTQNRYQSVEGWVHRDDLFGNRENNYIDESRWSWSGAMGDLEGAQSIDMSLGYRLSKNLTAEANYGQATGDFSDIQYVYLKLNSSFQPIWRLTPYFALGAGVLKTSPNTKLVQSEQRNDTSMLAGIGLRSYLTRNFTMRLEYNQHLVLTDRDVNEDVNQWIFGLSVNF